MAPKKTAPVSAPAKTVKAEPKKEVPPPAPVTVVEDVVEVDKTLETIVEKMVALQALVKEVQALVKNHTKVYGKLQKIAEKAQRKKAAARKAPSGFTKPTKISAELASFLKVPATELLARTEVTKRVTAYIKEHKLYDEKNKRRILPNAALKKLLNVKDGEEVSYFTLQRYMAVHFPKN